MDGKLEEFDESNPETDRKHQNDEANSIAFLVIIASSSFA